MLLTIINSLNLYFYHPKLLKFFHSIEAIILFQEIENLFQSFKKINDYNILFRYDFLKRYNFDFIIINPSILEEKTGISLKKIETILGKLGKRIGNVWNKDLEEILLKRIKSQPDALYYFFKMKDFLFIIRNNEQVESLSKKIKEIIFNLNIEENREKKEKLPQQEKISQQQKIEAINKEIEKKEKVKEEKKKEEESKVRYIYFNEKEGCFKNITDEDYKEWEELFPYIKDIKETVRYIAVYLKSSYKYKYITNFRNYILSWLKKENQNEKERKEKEIKQQEELSEKEQENFYKNLKQRAILKIANKLNYPISTLKEKWKDLKNIPDEEIKNILKEVLLYHKEKNKDVDIEETKKEIYLENKDFFKILNKSLKKKKDEEKY